METQEHQDCHVLSQAIGPSCPVPSVLWWQELGVYMGPWGGKVAPTLPSLMAG